MSVRIFEVGPRDGLQNEPQLLTVDQKIGFIDRLVKSGVKDIEIGSFVHPKWIPQMADMEAVIANLDTHEGVNYWALVPNIRGLDRALKSGITHIAIFVSASEAHNRKNLNASIDESLKGLEETCRVASDNDLEIRAYVSMVFGCPYEGAVDFGKVLDISSRLMDFGATQISLGDTVGRGTPEQVKAGCRQALEQFGADNVALHLHDTQGLGLVNAYVAYQEGVRIFDSAAGGIGGCPYAPGAAGNLGTEDIINLCQGMNENTGIDIDKICDTSHWLASTAGVRISSKYFQYWQSRQ